jgi:hypothetical protein
MRRDIFDSTIPLGDPQLLQGSAYRRYLDEQGVETTQGGLSSRLSLLTPSLQADLHRTEARRKGSTEAVEVFAACIRHSSRVTLHLQCADHVVPLTVFPQDRLVHCPVDLGDLVERHVAHWRVLHLVPATLMAPGDADHTMVDDLRRYHPIAPLLWVLALRGPRRELLGEIAGPAVYRTAPGLDLSQLPVSGAQRAAIERLRGKPTSLADIARWPAFDRERAARLLNALYLQAGLIISRSHRDAGRWFGSRY